MNEENSHKHVFITGGTGSVGQSLVELFSSKEHNVTFQYHSNHSIAEKLKKSFRAKPLQIDFTNSFNLQELNFDIVINNAGINITDSFSHEVTIEDWNRTLLLNVTVPFQIAQLCLPYMMQKRWGRIINISSIYGLRGVVQHLPYNVSKHGMSGLTKTIAKEYAEYGITCNEICPGPIDSEMVRRIGLKEIASRGISLEAYLKEICSEIPAGRLCDPTEVAVLALFIASDEASYLNGVSIPLDGGLIA